MQLLKSLPTSITHFLAHWEMLGLLNPILDLHCLGVEKRTVSQFHILRTFYIYSDTKGHFKHKNYTEPHNLIASL